MYSQSASSRSVGASTRSPSHLAQHAAVPHLTKKTARGPSQLGAAATNAKLQPDWTGDGVASKMVNWLIATKPIFSLLQKGAKASVRQYATSRGLDWDAHVRRMQSPALAQEFAALRVEMERSEVEYPPYYLQPFHAYDEGNLNWLAAYEVEPATYAMALRTFKTEVGLTPQQALDKLRTGISSAITSYSAAHGVAAPSAIIDMGCSTGISTRLLAQAYPQAQVTGLDLSPHFLAIAEWEERRAERSHCGQRVHYMHGLAEASGLPSASMDIVAHNFVIHECPQHAITAFITEACRLLRPGGLLVFVDNNPRSETIQNLPPVIATLMKSTEPWSDEYYAYDVEANMTQGGFRAVQTVAVDHRHRAVMGIRA